ncbi:helix-turn-helix domain-containing protein [Bartonella tribocorum]|uniref:Transcriptional regulator n=1 Tax=Bartonella tribocorum (strain DSM 28219 / CCUG 45778 / CIP 105476 / IBS 506) TaxID=382640 RepID=A9IXN8_BART1|nr:helix-turn-helix domain-containing protein [Bartonella tribocorum]CAK02210.1 transcriptional regulator [Bartonella tribocorum CIP 105476]CDO49500.1 transcriptional regulator [Bartonella tribocorum]
MQSKNPHFQTKNPHFIDVSIGKRIRHRRMTMWLSQKTLGNFLGVSFQQIQKYEKGLNRVSAKCLLEIAQKLQVPISFFYEDLLATDLATKEDLVSEGNPSHHDQYTYSEKEHALLKNFRELQPKKQKAILWLLSD